MRIMVCIKNILDVRLPVQVNRKGDTVALKNCDPVYIINPPDMSALEAAMSGKDSGNGSELIAVMVGGSGTGEALRYCLARGADKAWRIWEDGLDGGDPYLVSLILSRAAGKYSPDLIICGISSEDSNNGLLPAMLAERLKWPWINQVTDFKITDEGTSIKALKRAEKGSRIEVKCRTPAVLSIDRNSFPQQYVSANRLRSARHELITGFSPEDLSITGDEIDQSRRPVKVIRTRFPKPRIKRTAIPVQEVPGEELLWKMISGSNSKKEDKLLVRGSPSEQAVKIINFLMEKNMLTV